MSVFAPIVALQLQLAHGWETDQLSHRAEPLPDAGDAANARVDVALDAAAARASRVLGTRAPSARVHRVLARAVWRELGHAQRVPGRGWLRGYGYGRYAAWLEGGAVPREDLLDRSDLFAGLTFAEAPVLATVGTCSTVRLAGVRMGTDKPDHFFGTGWRYLRRAGTEEPARAVRWGTAMERTWLGWLTSSAFSRADLHANWQGWRFYATLLDPETGPFRAAAGEVERVRGFAWHAWVDPRWDELVYPSIYRPRVLDHLAARLHAERDRYCAAAGDLAGARAALGDGPEPWIEGRHPPLVDPFATLLDCGR
jgi:hypothetical protein